ncbi:hypothetical protein Tco_1343947, partial [Tanacetum coccineum]
GASSSAVIRGSGLRDDQAVRVYATVVSHSWNEGLHETSFYNDVVHQRTICWLLWYSKSKCGVSRSCKKRHTIRCSRFVGVGSVSGGNDQPAFVSAGISAGTTHNVTERTVAPSWLEARYESLMVLHRDENIKLFMREFERVSKERGELQKQVISLERELIRPVALECGECEGSSEYYVPFCLTSICVHY